MIRGQKGWPEGQSRTADTIKDVARHEQIILTTCLPSHATILGGHQIYLD